jgi:hypothetical protein
MISFCNIITEIFFLAYYASHTNIKFTRLTALRTNKTLLSRGRS